MISKSICNKIYDILIEECDAPLHYRDRFIQYFSENKDASEWRIFGNLGFGGKFWNNYGFYVNYYLEDETSEYMDIIKKANDRLQVLWEDYSNE